MDSKTPKTINKILELEEQSKANMQQRVENTMAVFREIAKAEMTGKEKEDFLSILGDEEPDEKTEKSEDEPSPTV